jgi:acarbose 7IV-phosphotransferase
MSEKPNLDVVVFGAAGVDTCAYIGTNELDLSREGTFSQNLDYVGGSGGFSARIYAQLGYRVAFAGYVGDDYQGRFIAGELQNDGIETHLWHDPAGTRRSVNIMYKDGRRKNFYDGKGSMNLQPDLDAARKLIKRARFVHFSIENWTRYLLPVARELGVTITTDLQDVPALNDPYRQDYIEAADVLCSSATNQPDPSDWLTELLAQRPARPVVVGMGSRGCALAMRDGIKFFPPAELPDAPVVDTNGAGDGLATGFNSAYILDGLPPEEAIKRGLKIARRICSLKATSSGLVTKD